MVILSFWAFIIFFLNLGYNIQLFSLFFTNASMRVSNVWQKKYGIFIFFSNLQYSIPLSFLFSQKIYWISLALVEILFLLSHRLFNIMRAAPFWTSWRKLIIFFQIYRRIFGYFCAIYHKNIHESVGVLTEKKNEFTYFETKRT